MQKNALIVTQSLTGRSNHFLSYWHILRLISSCRGSHHLIHFSSSLSSPFAPILHVQLLHFSSSIISNSFIYFPISCLNYYFCLHLYIFFIPSYLVFPHFPIFFNFSYIFSISLNPFTSRHRKQRILHQQERKQQERTLQ